jgi:hypothetical protein
LRRECRRCRVNLWCLTRVLFVFAREAAGAPAPGIPCALLIKGGLFHAALGRENAAREGGGVP